MLGSAGSVCSAADCAHFYMWGDALKLVSRLLLSVLPIPYEENQELVSLVL